MDAYREVLVLAEDDALDRIRDRLAAIGVMNADTDDAIVWARGDA